MNKKNRHCVYVSPSIESIFGINKEIAKPLLEVQKLEQDTTNDFTIDEIINLEDKERDWRKIISSLSLLCVFQEFFRINCYVFKIVSIRNLP